VAAVGTPQYLVGPAPVQSPTGAPSGSVPVSVGLFTAGHIGVSYSNGWIARFTTPTGAPVSVTGTSVGDCAWSALNSGNACNTAQSVSNAYDWSIPLGACDASGNFHIPGFIYNMQLCAAFACIFAFLAGLTAGFAYRHWAIALAAPIFSLIGLCLAAPTFANWNQYTAAFSYTNGFALAPYMMTSAADGTNVYALEFQASNGPSVVLAVFGFLFLVLEMFVSARTVFKLREEGAFKG